MVHSDSMFLYPKSSCFWTVQDLFFRVQIHRHYSIYKYTLILCVTYNGRLVYELKMM